MNTKTVTAHGGPLHGKRYTVHINTEHLDLRFDDGHYRVTEKQARWIPNQNADNSDPGGMVNEALHGGRMRG